MAKNTAEDLAALKKKLRSLTRPGGRPRRSLPCQHPRLAEQLPQGWPRGELTEILAPCLGIGEFSLLAPSLAALTQNNEWLALVNPPYSLQAAALNRWRWKLQQVLVIRCAGENDTLWAMEQCLRAGVCGAVIGWVAQPGDRQLRRLQLAAEHGASAGILFRPLNTRQQRSPAALRLCLQPLGRRRLRSTVIKQRGGRGQPQCTLTAP